MIDRRVIWERFRSCRRRMPSSSALARAHAHTHAHAHAPIHIHIHTHTQALCRRCVPSAMHRIIWRHQVPIPEQRTSDPALTKIVFLARKASSSGKPGKRSNNETSRANTRSSLYRDCRGTQVEKEGVPELKSSVQSCTQSIHLWLRLEYSSTKSL